MVNEMPSLKLWDDPGPDRGYSWVVIVFTFLINLLTVGYGKCQGNLFIEIQKSVGVNREQAAWPGTIYMLSYSFSALFAGIANHYFSWRQVLTSLVTLGLIGFVCGFFGPSTIPWICLYQGIIGIAIGPIYPILLQITSSYFVKHRSKAQNITIAGFSLGSLIYPVLLEQSVNSFGLRGSWLITGGVFMQTLIFVMLMRPLTLEHYPVLGHEKCAPLLLKSPQMEPKDTNKCIIENETSIESKTYQLTLSFNNKSIVKDKYQKVIPLEVKKFDKPINCQDTDLQKEILNEKEINNVFSKSPDQITSESQSFAYLEDMKVLLTDPLFLLFIVTITIEVSLYISSSFLIIDHGIDTGLSVMEATMLVVTISIGDGLARLLIGWIIDKNILGLMKFYGLGCFLQSIIYATIGFAPTTELLFIACFMNGVFFCLTSGLRTLITTNTYGIERAVTITGMMIGLQGIFLVFSPFIIGFLREGFGSYTYLFVLYSLLNVAVVMSIIVIDIYGRNKR